MSIKKKVCLLGPYGVGKTSLIRRFVHDKFEEKYLSTIGVQISKKNIALNNKINFDVELLIWDIANIDKFDSIVKTYLKGSDGAIFVVDLTRISTFDHIKTYIEYFKSVNGENPFVFALNKIDLIEEGSLEGDHYKKLLGINEICFTSAKTGENVESLFINLVEKLF